MGVPWARVSWFLLDEQVALADAHHELGVVAVLLTGHMLGAMPVDPESDLQALDAVRLSTGGEQFASHVPFLRRPQ